MNVRLHPVLLSTLAASATLCCLHASSSDAGALAASSQAAFWRDPGDISSRDLFYGRGGPDHQPRGPFTFVKEDLDGSNPKFVVTGGDGMKWKVKLGAEARPETVATRFVWAVGYYANEDYFLPTLQVAGMPAHLHRGQNLVGPNGTVSNVRLKREDEKKLGQWQWRDDPFSGTREWYGLRVMMAVINNWDLKDENNSIYRHGGQNVYMVSDLGASFGTDHAALPLSKSKGNAHAYEHSRFIARTTPEMIDFANPGRPELLWIFRLPNYFMRLHIRWTGKNIPREDARWIGNMLRKLSPKQIQDAFRAAGYSQAEIDEFSAVIQHRISELTEL